MNNRIDRNIHLPEADGIRGLACLIVLIVHTIAITYPQSFPYLTGCGKIGVWLFFSLSAYLLTHQFLCKGFSKEIIVDYFISRFFRIYPLLFIAVLVYYYLGTAGINNARDVLLALTFQKGFAHLWIIPVQFKFYFILPIFVWIGQVILSRFGFKGLIIAAFLFIIIHQIYFPYWKLSDNSIETIWYLPVFIFGVLGAFITLSFHIPQKVATYVGILALMCIFLATPFMRFLLLGMPPSHYLMNKYIYIGFAWTAFIISQINTHGSFSKILTHKWFCSIGAWSYSIYVFHYLIVNKMAQIFPQKIVTVAISIILSIFIGYVSYSFLERYSLVIKRRVTIAYKSL